MPVADGKPLPGAANVWRDAILLDTGDCFSDVGQLQGERGAAVSPLAALAKANTMATAELLVDHYNAEGVRAQNIGERDLALGRAALESLKARAKYPFVTTNLVDAGSGKPLFSRFVLVDVVRADKHVKLAIFGLMSNRPAPSLEVDKLKILPPIEALKGALADAKAQGAEVIIVLSQLLARDEAAVGEAYPEVQLFLGGDFMGMSPDAELAGRALSFAGSQKGKHLGFMTLKFGAPAGASAPFIDPKHKASIERKRADAQRRVDTYQKLITEAGKPPGSPSAAVAPPGTQGSGERPKVPLEVYERQLASAKAELQLALDAVAAMGPSDADADGINKVSLELLPLSRDVVDDPTVKALIEAFRKKWPDLTPGH